MATITTGETTEYDGIDEAVIEDYFDDAYDAWDGGGGAGRGGGPAGGAGTGGAGQPTRIRVSAQIEWSGVVDRARNGHRTTTLDGLNLAGVAAALDRARSAARAADQARPAESYRAQGWQAQIRALTESSRGSAAADRAGLAPSARTLTAWLSEERTPNRANRERIAAAYGELRTWNVSAAARRHAEAQHELAEKLSEAIRDRYGAEVRLREISQLELLP